MGGCINSFSLIYQCHPGSCVPHVLRLKIFIKYLAIREPFLVLLVGCLMVSGGNPCFITYMYNLFVILFIL